VLAPSDMISPGRSLEGGKWGRGGEKKSNATSVRKKRVWKGDFQKGGPLR